MEEEEKLSFGLWLRRRRRALDMTQEAFARLIGYSVGYLRDIEQGKYRASKQLADKLAQHLNVPSDMYDDFVRFARKELNTGLPPSAQLASSILPLHPLSPRPGTRPLFTTALIGREQQVKTLCAWLCDPEKRLVTLTGPGGVGKTRIAVQVEMELENIFADQRYLVRLETIDDPELVLSAIARALGVSEIASQPLGERLQVYLQNKQVLLVLDNFEQVLAAAELVEELLEASPNVKVLVTSRAPLRLWIEHEFVVPPLEVLDPMLVATVDNVADCSAVSLFVQRAEATRSGFALTNENVAVVAEICAQLDGLPLAIELAAARINVLSPQQILFRLETGLGVLARNIQYRPKRHQTLKATLAWSYDLLNGSEQVLFRRLGVFAGGCTVVAAEAVCNGEGDLSIEVIDGIVQLLEQSLLRQDMRINNIGRFRFLETIRRYALERLSESGELHTIMYRYATYYLALAQEVDQQLTGLEQEALERLEVEHRNIRASMEWALNHDIELAMQLGAALGRFWFVRGYWSEGREWLEKLLIKSSQDSGARALVIRCLGYLMWCQGGKYEEVGVLLDQSLTLFKKFDDKAGMADTLRHMGMIAFEEGDYRGARSLYQESLILFKQLGDEFGRADVLRLLGVDAVMLGLYSEARKLLEQSLLLCRQLRNKSCEACSLRALGESLREIRNYQKAAAFFDHCLRLFEDLGDKWQVAWTYHNLGELAQLQEKYAEASEWYQKSLMLFKDLAAGIGIAWSLNNLGYLASEQGNINQGEQYFTEALSLFYQMSLKEGIGDCLVGLARVIERRGRPKHSAWLLGAATTLNETAGVSLRPIARARYESIVIAVQKQLGEASFGLARQAGQKLSLDGAVAIALNKRVRQFGT